MSTLFLCGIFWLGCIALGLVGEYFLPEIISKPRHTVQLIGDFEDSFVDVD